ncbi:hypothetical protein PA598K_05247 [Paenibacillus sp. 598K]|nr:hypothetical protein PA598K_05247 [Paenibacillus sp. 598K]
MLIGAGVYQYRKGVQHAQYKRRASAARAVIQSIQQVGGNELQALVQLRLHLDYESGEEKSAALTVKMAIPIVRLADYQGGCTVSAQYDGSRKIIIGGLMGKVV